MRIDSRGGLREAWACSNRGRNAACQPHKAPRCHVGEGLRFVQLPDNDRDLLRVEWRILRNVLIVPKQELQRMASGWQLESCLGLARPKMQVIFVIRDWLIEWRQVGVY